MPPFRFSLLACLGAAAISASCDDAAVRAKVTEQLHIPKQPSAVEAERFGTFSPAPGVLADRVSYATGYNLRVPAIVYHPANADAGRLPALLIVNGHGGDKASWYAYWAGILYARAGAVVLTYDPIGEFERNHLRQSNTRQHDRLLQPEALGRRLGGLMVDDIRQAVSYLDRRKDVDRHRIAVLGYSMGSFVTAIACAVDPRIHACVLTGGGDLDGPGGYWDTSSRMCQAIPYGALLPLGDRGPVLFGSIASHAETLVWNGSADTVVDVPHHAQSFFADLRQRTSAQPGINRKNVFEYGFTPGGGHRPYFLTKPVALWLTKRLHFAHLTPAEIDAMPETVISNWASANHLSQANLNDLKNEGGTLALGSDIPAIQRDLLHALPDSVWDSHRDRYIYETWVNHAEAALRAGTP